MKRNMKTTIILLSTALFLAGCAGTEIFETDTDAVYKMNGEVSKEFAISANGNYYSNVSAADSENE